MPSYRLELLNFLQHHCKFLVFFVQILVQRGLLVRSLKLVGCGPYQESEVCAVDQPPPEGTGQ